MTRNMFGLWHHDVVYLMCLLFLVCLSDLLAVCWCLLHPTLVSTLVTATFLLRISRYPWLPWFSLSNFFYGCHSTLWVSSHFSTPQNDMLFSHFGGSSINGGWTQVNNRSMPSKIMIFLDEDEENPWKTISNNMIKWVSLGSFNIFQPQTQTLMKAVFFYY